MNQRKRAVWGFILCSLLCCGAGVSAKEAAAGEKAAMPLWTRAAVQYENPYFTGNPDASLSAETLSSWWTVFHDDTLNPGFPRYVTSHLTAFPQLSIFRSSQQRYNP